MFFRSAFIILIMLSWAGSAFSSSLGQAKVLLVQISDTHSKLEDFVQVLSNIDKLGQEFLRESPDGEVVVFWNGDVTGINLFSEEDMGRSTLEALRLLKLRGYTVVFNLGNHDGFDWASTELNEAELVLEQLQMLHDWGVVILTSNITKPSEPLRSLLSPHYRLQGLNRQTYLVGLTLETLLKKSNLTRGNAPVLFKKVLSYKKSLMRSVKRLENEGVESADIIVGVHKGYRKLTKLAEKLRAWSVSSGMKFKFPVLLAADDHLVSSNRLEHGGAVISDAGAHGAFNTLALAADGELIDLTHYEVSQGLSEYEEFNLGARRLQRTDLSVPDFLADYASSLSGHIQAVVSQNSTPLVTITQNINVNKHDMKLGSTLYGSMNPETLVLWARESMPRYADEVIVAMSHTSSYRTERRFRSGDTLSKMDLNEIYPYPQESSLFRLRGSEINKLYKSLKKSYALTNPGRFTPQLSLNLREGAGGALEFMHEGEWQEFRSRETYLVAFDAWLSMNRSGEGPEVKEWVEVMSSRQPLMTAPHKDLISRYWVRVLEANGLGVSVQNRCRRVLGL